MKQHAIEVEQVAEIICAELFGPRTPFDGDSPNSPYGQSLKAAQAIADAGLLSRTATQTNEKEKK